MYIILPGMCWVSLLNERKTWSQREFSSVRGTQPIAKACAGRIIYMHPSPLESFFDVILNVSIPVNRIQELVNPR